MKTLTLSIACGLALITATSAWAAEPPRVERSRVHKRAQAAQRVAAPAAPEHHFAPAGRIKAFQRAIARRRNGLGEKVGLDGVDGEMPSPLPLPHHGSAASWVGLDGVDGEKPLPLSIRRALVRRNRVGLDGVDGELPSPVLADNADVSPPWIALDGVDGEQPLPLSIRRALVRRNPAGLDGIDGEQPLPQLLRRALARRSRVGLDGVDGE